MLRIKRQYLALTEQFRSLRRSEGVPEIDKPQRRRYVGREPSVKRGSNLDDTKIKSLKIEDGKNLNFEDEPDPQYSAVVNKLRSYIEPPAADAE